MSTERSVAGFPDVENKLQAPTKKSLFERQRADAEAKRQREQAETQAVYEDFVKSFDNEDQDLRPGQGLGAAEGAAELGSTTKGYFINPLVHGKLPGNGSIRGSGGERNRGATGPGSLGPPPPGLNRKRPYENTTFPPRRIEKVDKGLLAFEDYEAEDGALKKPFSLENDDERRNTREEERAVPKPTVRLASLPPGTSPAVIKALIPSKLTVENVKILPPVGPAVYSERKSMSAIVTLARETAANDIDAAVSSLQNQYLGYGYYLNIYRHLSSAALSSSSSISMPSLGTALVSQPFGARAVDLSVANRSHATPVHQGKFAPPTSYDSVRSGRAGPLLYVPVQAPQDLKQLKLIHKVIESLLTYGPEFEALLMSRPDVQKEEKWAWLWDARSTGAAWYRWRLWEVLTGIQTRRGQGKYIPLFEGSSAWKIPNQPLAYEYTTRLEEFVSDSEYNSSNDDDSGDEAMRRQNLGSGAPTDAISSVEDEKSYLNPLEKAKLTHLLARLPTTTGTLRKGDVARVTAFAIFHAGRGADEVVHMIISNIERPFAYTSANPERKKDKEKESGCDDDEDSDTSGASLIGLYLISDILSCSSTSGVRHAWKYRQIFEAALKQRHVFEGLGRMENKMNWGRLRAEKWKRSVENILRLWEGWCVFPHESQENFARLFDKPPLTAAQEELEKAARKNEEKTEEKGKGSNKWKAVETKVRTAEDLETDVENMDEDIDGASMDDNIDGEPMSDDDDLDGVPMDYVEPIAEIHESAPGAPSVSNTPVLKADSKEDSPIAPQSRVKRPKAIDMFADSDSDEL